MVEPGNAGPQTGAWRASLERVTACSSMGMAGYNLHCLKGCVHPSCVQVSRRMLPSCHPWEHGEITISSGDDPLKWSCATGRQIGAAAGDAHFHAATAAAASAKPLSCPCQACPRCSSLSPSPAPLVAV